MKNVQERYVITKYPFNRWAAQQRDKARSEARIQSSAIFRGAVYQAMIGGKSVLEMDQRGRSKKVREQIGFYGSDTTWLSALSQWDTKPSRQALSECHKLLCARQQAETVLSDGRCVRLGVVDGTEMGGIYFSVLTVAGEVEHVLDVEVSRGLGHELATSRRVLRRMESQEGEEGKITHIVGDGLYLNRPFLKFVHEELGRHGVIKTKERKLGERPEKRERVEILESTQEVWSRLEEKELKASGVAIDDFVDASRAIAYHVMSQAGIAWEGLPFTLKLAWVRKTQLKGQQAGQSVYFWVLSTDETLAARDLVLLGQSRWTIENNTFKELSEQVGSKKAYIKNVRTKEALLLMWSLGLMLLKAFSSWLEEQPAWKAWGVRKTKKLIAFWFTWDIDEQASPLGLAPP